MLVLFGTYARSADRGISAARLDSANGTLSEPWLAAEARNPTFLALHPDRRRVIATGEFGAPPAGGVGSFVLDRDSGRLAPGSSQSTGGAGTTYVAADATGRAVALASYHSGYLCALPLDDRGLGPPAALIEPHGPAGPNRARQDRPHPHSVAFSPDNRFVLACDLGLDRVLVYRFEAGTAALAPNEPAFAAAPPGSGPRHGKFSPEGRFFYVSNELGGSVSQYSWDPAAGTLSLDRTVSTLPPDFSGDNLVAEIALHPNGRFAYASNRGHESLAAFSRDGRSGALSLIGLVPCGGRHPRHFALAPDGRWLLCANRETNSIAVFRVDPSNGALSPTGQTIAVPEPVCVLFV